MDIQGSMISVWSSEDSSELEIQIWELLAYRFKTMRLNKSHETKYRQIRKEVQGLSPRGSPKEALNESNLN